MMSPRFTRHPLALALLALNSASAFAETADSASPALSADATAQAAAVAQTPEIPANPTTEQTPIAASVTLDTVVVRARAIVVNPHAQEGIPYKAVTSGDARHTRPLAETPQNISVITKAAIEDSGYTDLREILDAQPGITLGTGENGNAFGDRYIIRGQEARSDIFVDGLRDPGMSIRESFAVDQVEISKGPNSSFAGRGTSGGAVNAITKQAEPGVDFARLSVGAGSDLYQRYTVDANKVVNDELAVRVNALYAYEEVPDRAPADRERQGLATSAHYQPSSDLGITVDYYGLRANDNPDLGGFLKGTIPNRFPVKNPPVYVQEEDFLESDVDTFTSRLEYRVNDHVRISNLTRYGMTENGYVATGARANTTGANNPGGVYDTVTLSTHQGWQEVNYLANQTNLFFTPTLAGKKHEFILGLEYTDHDVLNGNYTVTNSGQNCITGTGTTLNAWCIVDSTGNAVNGVHTIMNRQISKGDWDQDWAIKTTAFSLMDTVDVTDSVTVFGGVRYDHFDYDLKAYWNHDNSNTTANVLGDFKASDGFVNGHLGVTYKFTPTLNVYASYSTANDINGGESDVGTSSGYGGLAVNLVCTDISNPDPTLRGCDPNGSIEAKPEKTQLMEIGSKWNVFDESLLLTASLFDIIKSDVMEGSGYETGASFNTGKNQVRGLEVSATGEVTEKITVQAGATWMRSEVLESVTAANEGKTLSNFANRTASLQVKYQATDKFNVGSALKYESGKYAGQPDSAAAYDSTTGQYTQPIPGYTVTDVFAGYQVNDNLDFRLNVGNVTNRDYYQAGYRSGSFLYIGDARNVRLTMDYNF